MARTSLWEMQYIDWQTGITLSSDGHHAVVWGGWSTYSEYYPNTYTDTALSFYEDGRFVGTYTVNELVVQPDALPHSVSHYQWLLDSSLDDVHGLLNVETYNHEKYMFALNTGRIASAIIPTATPGSKANRQRDVIVASISTALPKPEVPAIPAITPPVDSPLSMGVLVSIGSLSAVFAGVNFLSARARRRRGRGNKRKRNMEMTTSTGGSAQRTSQFHVRVIRMDPARPRLRRDRALSAFERFSRPFGRDFRTSWH